MDKHEARAEVFNNRHICLRNHKHHHWSKETANFLITWCKVCRWFCGQE